MEEKTIINIAIADDYQLFRKGLALALNTIPGLFVSIEAEDGIDLLEKIETASKLPEICLLDISMPKMDGYEALKHLKAKWPQLKVIVLSMHHNEYTVIRSFQNGASACLPKEVEESKLHHVILQVNELGIYHSELTSHFINKLVLKENINTDLTEKEIEFLRLVCSDINYKQIADIMKVSHRTIDSYRDNLFSKLKVNSRSALAVFAIKSGISPTINENK